MHRKVACLVFVACAALAQTTQAQVTQREPVAASKSRTAVPGVEASRPDTAEAARRIVTLTNAFRSDEKLAPTGPAPQLASTARYFADFMARTGKFSHSADGTEPAARAKRFGYEYCTVAENIGYVFSAGAIDTADLARRLFEGWQNSPEHRKNMVNPDVTETAVAIARSATTDYYYAVQLFGRPMSQMIEFEVANRTGVGIEYELDGRTYQLPTRTTGTHQVCSRPTIKFRGKTLQPVNGQQLVIVNDQNGMQLQAQ
ncbi:MAG TPA: CAP domain-containing protein [Burkholderiaceae bacterium]|nr:CAP domain-containing protein [Burkholderiaceae bacterium]